MTNQAASTADEQYVVVDKDFVDSTPPPDIFLKGLSILSPRQKKNKHDDYDVAAAPVVAVTLPPLRPEEPVASLRSALSEVIGFAHLTKYRLVLERVVSTTTKTTAAVASAADGTTTTTTTTSKGGNKKSNTKNNGAATKINGSNSSNGEHKEWEADNVVSTFTLDGAAMAIDKLVMTLKLGRAPDGLVGGQDAATTTATTAVDVDTDEIELDDYGDLSILLDVLEKEGNHVKDKDDSSPPTTGNNNNKIIIDASSFAFRVVLEKYNVASIRDHMVRVRQLLEGNAPHLTTLMGDLEEEDTVEEEGKASVEKKEQIAKKDNSESGDDEDKEVNEDGKTAKDKVSFIPT
jgi:hypothetical protein